MADEGDQPGDDQNGVRVPQEMSFNHGNYDAYPSFESHHDQEPGDEKEPEDGPHVFSDDQEFFDGPATGIMPENSQNNFSYLQFLGDDLPDVSMGNNQDNLPNDQQLYFGSGTDPVPRIAQPEFAIDEQFYPVSQTDSVPVNTEHNFSNNQQFHGDPGNASMFGGDQTFASQQHFQGLGHGSASGDRHHDFGTNMQYHNLPANVQTYEGGQPMLNFNNAQQHYSNPTSFACSGYGSQEHIINDFYSNYCNQIGRSVPSSSSFNGTQQYMNKNSDLTVNPSDLSTRNQELQPETWQQLSSLQLSSPLESDPTAGSNPTMGSDPTMGLDPAMELEQDMELDKATERSMAAWNFLNSPLPLQSNTGNPSTNVTGYHSQQYQTHTASNGQVSESSVGEQDPASNNQSQHDFGHSELFVDPEPDEDLPSSRNFADIDNEISPLEKLAGSIDNFSQLFPDGDDFALVSQPGGETTRNHQMRPLPVRPDAVTRERVSVPISLDAEPRSSEAFQWVNRALLEVGNGRFRHFPAIRPILPRLLPGEIRDHRSVNRPRDAFSIILDKALGMGLRYVLENGGVKFTIGTMCSGTDGPIMALQEFQDALIAAGLSNTLQFEHKFSVEIEPFKQAFIDRNARPTGHIYRNVNDFGIPGATEAMTASGAMEPIPRGIDILVAGSSCVDFSLLNKKKLQRKEASGMSKLGKKVVREKGQDPDVASQETGQDPAAASQDDEAEPVGAPQYDEEPVVALQDDEEFLAQLNELTDKLRDEHESTKTFVSIFQYVRQHRPKIVILENVVSAPWSQFRHFYAKIGYDTRIAKVDAKWYLMPQTRQRIYLIAVDRRRYGEKANGIVREWGKIMSQKWFDQPPDLQKFLLQPSDPRILQARYMLELKAHNKPKKEVEAVACMMEHSTARRKHDLGDSNPYTQLDARGLVQPREDSWEGYVRNLLTTRMQDLVDILYLKGIQKGVDIAHKAIVYDIGQNVQRQRDSLGALPCILPNADLFLSIQGRPILGLEGLALQGIPIDRMKSSRESEAQLKSLAGNAMTTTVVGAAILSALFSERKFVEDAQGHFLEGLSKASDVDMNMDVDSDVPRAFFAGEVGPPPASTSSATAPAHLAGHFSSHNNFCPSGTESATTSAASSTNMANASEIPELAEGPDWKLAKVDGSDPPVWLLCLLCQEGRRYCLCDNYRKHEKVGEHYICKYCGEIRCISCIGNPEHDFDMDKPVNVLSKNKQAALQETIARLPGRLEISLGDNGNIRLDGNVLGNVLQNHQDALESAIRACAGGVEYFLTDVNFRDDLTITYESAKSRILIVVTHACVTWNVYLRGAIFDKNAECDITDPRHLLQTLGYDLEQPLLRATLTDAPSFIPTAND